LISIIGIFLFSISVVIVFIQQTHFLSVLLVIELITLRLFFIRVSCLGGGFGMSGISFGLIFLTFGVYEAANGLGLLVSRTRSSGMDQLSRLFRLRF
jgi:NADH:ubiquinone oxidoreductase subunit K